MNVFEGTVFSIRTSGKMSQVVVKSGDITFTTIVIDTPESCDYLVEGKPIQVIFKETEVIISKDLNPAISLRNRVKGTIDSIERGELLSKIEIRCSAGVISSYITSNAVEELNLDVGDLVLAMIKSNEIMLSK